MNCSNEFVINSINCFEVDFKIKYNGCVYETLEIAGFIPVQLYET